MGYELTIVPRNSKNGMQTGENFFLTFNIKGQANGPDGVKPIAVLGDKYQIFNANGIAFEDEDLQEIRTDPVAPNFRAELYFRSVDICRTRGEIKFWVRRFGTENTVAEMTVTVTEEALDEENAAEDVKAPLAWVMPPVATSAPDVYRTAHETAVDQENSTSQTFGGMNPYARWSWMRMIPSTIPFLAIILSFVSTGLFPAILVAISIAGYWGFPTRRSSAFNVALFSTIISLFIIGGTYGLKKLFPDDQQQSVAGETQKTKTVEPDLPVLIKVDPLVVDEIVKRAEEQHKIERVEAIKEAVEKDKVEQVKVEKKPQPVEEPKAEPVEEKEQPQKKKPLLEYHKKPKGPYKIPSL